MSAYEHVAVFVSIVFGLGLTHLLTGAIQRFYEKRGEYLQAAYTVNALVVTTIAWWTLFQARDDVWTFDLYFVTVLWALCQFGLCVAIYPPGEAGKQPFEAHRRLVLLLMIVLVLLDVVQTVMAGALSWPYALLMGHTIALAIAALLIRNKTFQVIVATYFPAILLLWAFVVRRVLA